MKKTSEVTFSPSITDGIFWPTLPSHEVNAVLALAYQLEHSQWWAPEVLTAIELRQVEKLLEHAWRTVPNYRQRLDDAVKITSGKLHMDDFRKIPRAASGKFEETICEIVEA